MHIHPDQIVWILLILGLAWVAGVFDTRSKCDRCGRMLKRREVKAHLEDCYRDRR